MENSPDKMDSENLFEVEKILKHKTMTSGKKLYFVKWKVCKNSRIKNKRNTSLHYSNGQFIYFVLYDLIIQGYDSSHNSWEPEHHFASLKLIQNYHDEKSKAKSIAKASKKIEHDNSLEMDEMKDTTKMDDQQNVADVQQSKNGKHDDEIPLKNCEFLSEKEIDDRELIPEKVLNMFHVKNDEKTLVAHVQFKNQLEPVFVLASWANQKCPLMVIQFYENRIYWHQKS